MNDLRQVSDPMKPVAVIGMGKTGQAVARFLIDKGMRCEAFDERPVELAEDLHLPLHVGPLDATALSAFARVIVSPGINWQHPTLVALRRMQVPVCGDLDLFSENFKGEWIGVTGTNGKTTTVSLISTMLDILPGGIEAGGNIGTPMLELIDDNHETKRVVLELSSFQLERAGPIRPAWAALLNVQPDHADMHADAEAYKAAKLRLFAGQGAGDKAMLPADSCWDEVAHGLAERGVIVRRFGIGSPTDLDAGVEMLADGSWRAFWHHGELVESVSSTELASRGAHQHLNLAVAAQAAADFGVSSAVISQSLTSFRGLPHRLQSLGVVAGREWFDDSKATNPDAARAALCSFERVLWICGGLRKGLDLMPLRQTVAEHVEHAFVIGNDAGPFVELAAAAGVSVNVSETMQRAVDQIAQLEGELPVLLAPAAASQDQFRDYAERGEVFAAAVAHLGQPL